jgi:hypothetical protein
LAICDTCINAAFGEMYVSIPACTLGNRSNLVVND